MVDISIEPDILKLSGNNDVGSIEDTYEIDAAESFKFSVHPSYLLEGLKNSEKAIFNKTMGTLLFVGDGKAKKDLVEYVFKKDLNEHVEFRTSVPHEKIADILSELQILVLPSYDVPAWREQFGHVLIEAMSCKIPVVGSTGGQIPNVIGNAGLIFKQKNENELSICLKKLMNDDSLRKRLGQSGYERFRANYSYEIIADKTYSFWRRMNAK